VHGRAAGDEAANRGDVKAEVRAKALLVRGRDMVEDEVPGFIQRNNRKRGRRVWVWVWVLV
jgi:hypothetical protein